jgi:hypothetical protein
VYHIKLTIAVKKTQFPQSFRVFLHMISDEQLLLLYPSSGKLAGLSIRTDSMEVDERFTFINGTLVILNARG